MTKPFCMILIGPPASGKSTYRANIDGRLRRDPVIISSDDLIEEYAAANGCTYSEAFGRVDMKAIDKILNERIGDAIGAGDDLIIDRTNMTRKSRNRILSRLTKNYKRIAVNFTLPRDVLDSRLLARATATGKHIPKEVVDRMISDYMPPSLEEFDEIIEQ